MARPRRPRPPKPPKRDYKSAYARRDARAKARGYKSYYDYRTHDYGKLPANANRLIPGVNAFLRGLDEGDTIIMPEGIRSVERDAQGRYIRIVKIVLDAVTARERRFVLRNLTRPQLIALIKAEQAKGAIFSLSPSLDQRKLLPESDVEGGYRPENRKR